MKKRKASYVQLFVDDHLRRPAWQTLSVGARALLIELKSLYHGKHNGSIYLSVREAARRLSGAGKPVGKTAVSDWFWELQDRGWIKPKVAAGFDWKTAARERMATCWILTEYPTPGAAPTREFATWEGPPKPRPKNIRRSGNRDSLSLSADRLSGNRDSAPKTRPICPSQRTDSAETTQICPSQRTQIVTRERELRGDADE